MFIFEDVFDENVKNEVVMKKVGLPALENIMEGYNSTIFAYGMTGAGKTYTMFGNLSSPDPN